MIKKVVCMLLTLVILILTGCSVNDNKVRYIGFKVYDPVYIAKDKGFFEKHNVNVEIIDLVSAGPTALQTISGGSAVACLSSYMATISAVSTGLPLICVSDIQSSIGNQALEEFFVRADSGINDISGLKGKKIAVNLVKSSFHYTWLMALEQARLNENDIEFVILPFEQQELALENGSVDAIGLMQPYVLHAKDNTDFNVLFTGKDIFGDKQFTTHVINKDWAKANKDLAQGFTTAIAEAANWIQDNQVEAKEIISKYTGVDVKYIEDYSFQENAMIICEDAEYWLEYMKSRGDITNTDIKINEFVTNEYNLLIN